MITFISLPLCKIDRKNTFPLNNLSLIEKILSIDIAINYDIEQFVKIVLHSSKEKLNKFYIRKVNKTW